MAPFFPSLFQTSRVTGLSEVFRLSNILKPCGPSFFTELLRGWRLQSKRGARSRGEGQRSSGGEEIEEKGKWAPLLAPRCCLNLQSELKRRQEGEERLAKTHCINVLQVHVWDFY